MIISKQNQNQINQLLKQLFIHSFSLFLDSNLNSFSCFFLSSFQLWFTRLLAAMLSSISPILQCLPAR